MANPFDTIQRTPRRHFLLHFYGAVLHLLQYIDRTKALGSGWLQRPGSRYPFLAHYREEIQRFVPEHLSPAEVVAWWEDQVADWQAGSQGHLPLAALEGVPGVGPNGRTVFMLAGLVEEDSRFGTVLAHLQEPLPARRLALGLVSQLLAGTGNSTDIDAWETCRALFQVGALEAANPAAPRSEWMLQVPSLLWDAARGSLDRATSGWCVVHLETDFPWPEDLILPEDFIQRLRQAPALLEEGKARVLVLRGTPGSDRRQVVGAEARALGRQLIQILRRRARPQPI